jgi:hypothetical protein
MDSRAVMRHKGRMRFLLTIVALFLGFSGTSLAQDNAGLFFYGPAPSTDAIRKAAGDAQVTVDQVESVQRVVVSWPEVSVIIHIDHDWPREEQLSGIRGLLDGFSTRERNKPAVRQFLADLDRTTVCWGSIIEPGYDREGRVVAFFTRLIGTTGGFLFTYQSFYSSEGKRITGLEDDPEILK